MNSPLNSIIFSESALIKTAFGEVLNTHREDKGVTQREFARRAGVSNSHLRSIESGAVSPTLVTVGKLADVLDVEAADLVEETFDRVHRTRIEHVRNSGPVFRARDAGSDIPAGRPVFADEQGDISYEVVSLSACASDKENE